MPSFLRSLVNDEPGNTKTKIIGLYVLLVTFTLAAWCWAFAAFHRFPVLLGTAFLAYSLSLSLAISPDFLLEMVPAGLLNNQSVPAFCRQQLRIDARTQALVAMLRHSLRQGIAEPLEAEGLALTLVQRALGPRTTHAAGASVGQQRLVDRVKLVISSNLARRWTLAEIAVEVRGSPVYLTQVFRQVEGMPLYRYQLGLRLARALDLLDRYDDLTALSLELGFSSHSHFSSAFRNAYGRTPSEFKHSALGR